ncbi:hypothetical protein AOQ84DRAFT_165586 [Glonium stellatum]|uniref:Uncharacterized protein n=1 Tax=Glonium stellatum TaxID=574774 RepID=A0A8E2F7P0_9PEZI|nr:hypothetical protein AOQ84DRAFT_165586 [Glonium stellatum]
MLIFDSGTYWNEGIKYTHTVPFRDHSDSQEFRKIAREQNLNRYNSISFKCTTITNAARTEIEPGYTRSALIDSEKRTYKGRKLILVTGLKDIPPDIEGYKENWPSHI